MSTTVSLQLNAINYAGDWATRRADAARTGTGVLGGATRAFDIRSSGVLAVHLAELRGAVESLKRGAHSPNISDSRTEFAELAFGTPAMYCGLRFAFS